MSAPGTVAALVLAAGRSTRMGHFKLLADVGGEPMVRSVVRAALGARARPVLVVTGNREADLRAALAGLPVTFVHNPDFESGLASSLVCGLQALPPAAEGAVILLGDMPEVTAAHIDTLIAAFAPGRVVVPVRAGRRGNPVLWPRTAFAALLDLRGDQGARGLLGRMADAVCEVEMPSDAIFTDVDTPEALAELQKRCERPR